jgi:hypothetical protein
MTPKQIMDAPTVLMDAPKIYEWPPKFFFFYLTSTTSEKKIFSQILINVGENT